MEKKRYWELVDDRKYAVVGNGFKSIDLTMEDVKLPFVAIPGCSYGYTKLHGISEKKI